MFLSIMSVYECKEKSYKEIGTNNPHFVFISSAEKNKQTHEQFNAK